MTLSQPPSRSSTLAIYGLSYRYRSPGAPQALHEVSFELAEGEFVSLLGPNGSGKSTLMKVISGILSPAAGFADGLIKQGGEDLLRMSPGARSCRVSYIAPDLIADFPLTAREAVLMGRSVSGASPFARQTAVDNQRVEEAMKSCQCWELRDRDLRELSGGERQLVAVARALAHGARVLLVDEALSRMDLHHQALIGELLKKLCRERRHSVLLVSHDWNLATEWADRCVLLKEGRVVAEGASSVVLTTENLEKLYPKAPVWVAPHPIHGGPKVFFGKRPSTELES
jgi:iron complex transport system ATP-binding protein